MTEIEPEYPEPADPTEDQPPLEPDEPLPDQADVDSASLRAIQEALLGEPAPPDAPVLPARKPRRRFGARFRKFIHRVLLLIYILAVLAFGYWYWARPVRVHQFQHADEQWRAIAEMYGVPMPKDERWQP